MQQSHRAPDRPAIARTILLCALLITLAGCAQQRIAGRFCNLRMLPITLDAAAPAANIESGEPHTYREAVEAAARAAPAIERADAAAQHLVLSGGGKWGAFGAGFLQALPARPNWQVVTGVSTGSLQASFALIANQPVPAERAAIYTAANDLALDPGEPQPGKGRLFIDDLVRAYTVTRAQTIILVKGGELTALRHGAAGDFGPLRKRLTTLIDKDVLQRIAEAGSRDRRALFVGVVDADDGKAYAIDLVQLAQRAIKAESKADFDFLQGCYVDTLIASSSEPLEVAPVFIGGQKDNPRDVLPSRMYLDGGIRDGVFLEEVLKPDGSPRIESARPKIDTTIIINGALQVRDYTKQRDPKWEKQWSLLTLVGRTKDLLVDQIYQFSADRVRDHGSAFGSVRLTTARGYQDQPFEGAKCEDWQPDGKMSAQDAAFPPTFMRCLIAYGRARAGSPATRWDVDKGQAAAISTP